MDQEQLQKPGYWAVLPAVVRYDPELPPNAKILYAEISSLTDQRGFCYASNAYFMELYGMGARTVSRLISLLQSSGYIRIQDGDGGSGRRRIYAGINPLTDNPAENCGVSEEPCQKWRGNPAKNGEVTPQKIAGSINNSKENNNPPTSPPGGKRAKTSAPKTAPVWKPKRFEGLWNYYPRHTSKQAAIKAWDKLKPSDELIADIGKALRRQKAWDEWQRGIGIPHLSTYLNQRRWEDELEEARSTQVSNPDTREDVPWI